MFVSYALTSLIATDSCILCMDTVVYLSSSTLQYGSLSASTGHIIQVNGHSGRTLAKGCKTNCYSICVCTEFMDLNYIMGWKCMCLVTLIKLCRTAGNFRDHKFYGLRDTYRSLLHENQACPTHLHNWFSFHEGTTHLQMLISFLKYFLLQYGT